MINLINKRSLSIVLFSLIVLTTSCKKSIQEATEKVTKKTIRTIGNDISQHSLRKIETNSLKKMSEKDVMNLIRKDNIYLAGSLEKLDGGVQKSIVKEMKNDPNFFKAFTSYNSVLDDYDRFVKAAPSLKKDVNFLKMFSKANSGARINGHSNPFENIILEESNGVVKFVHLSDKSILGEYRKGVLFLKEQVSSIDRIIGSNSLLQRDLIPSSVYKLKGKNGLEYICIIDELGRPFKIKAMHVNPNEISTSIVGRIDDVNLGKEWNESFKKIKQFSNGNDLHVEYSLKYFEGNKTPQYVTINVKTNRGKNVLNKSFENLDVRVRDIAYSVSDNANVLKTLKKKAILPENKRTRLLQEMSEDNELAKLIHNNVDFNVDRWLKTRNHVDKHKLLKSPKGKYPINSQVYGGNVYYFNPHLNSKLKARLNKGNQLIDLRGKQTLTYDNLIELDRLYPNGVPFTKEGFPDFTSIAFKGNDGKAMSIDIGKLSGVSKKDIAIAERKFRYLGYKHDTGYTWHHIENSTVLQRVPTSIHQLIDHSGGMSMSK